MSRHETFSAARTRDIVSAHLDLEGPLLPILHAVQEAFGFVPEAAVPVIAEELNLSRAEVHGVVTFYHDFHRAPQGRHVLKLCQAEACQSLGCRDLTAQAERALGVGIGETSPDGRVTLEAIYCLGLCATGPAAMIDGRLVGRLTPAKIDGLCAEVDR